MKEQEKFIIDCDADPIIPLGNYGRPDFAAVVEHKKGGQIIWDPARVELWLDDTAEISPGCADPAYFAYRRRELDDKIREIETCKIRKKLATKTVLNANVLDFLLAHQELIPDEWRGKDDKHGCKPICFFGTIYLFYTVDSKSHLHVRYLSQYSNAYGKYGGFTSYSTAISNIHFSNNLPVAIWKNQSPR